MLISWCQAISNHNADMTEAMVQHGHITWRVYRITAIKQTTFEIGQEVLNLPVSLLSMCSFPHKDNALYTVKSLI